MVQNQTGWVSHRKVHCWSLQAAGEEGRCAQEGCEDGIGCRGGRSARGWPAERQRDRILDPVGCSGRD